MNERQDSKFLKHLDRFINEEDIPEITQMLEEGYSKAEIFHLYSAGKGNHKNHASAYANNDHYDYKLKHS